MDIDLKYTSEDHLVVTVFKLNISGALSFETYEIENHPSTIDDMNELLKKTDDSMVVDWGVWSAFHAKHESHIKMTPVSLQLGKE